MSPHHYSHWWYDDLPEEAKKAALAMGYFNKEDWDTDKEVPFDTKSFAELTMTERRASMFLGFQPIEKKLDPLWWSETPEETKAAAIAVGWTQETWDDDWRIQDLPIEHKYWNELTEEEKAGAMHFGYTRITWDETEEELFEDESSEVQTLAMPRETDDQEEEIEVEPEDNAEGSDSSEVPTLRMPPEADDREEEIEVKVEDDVEGSDEDDELVEISSEPPTDAQVKAPQETKKKNWIRYAHTKTFGNPENGKPFDDHNNKHICNITMWSTSQNVNAIRVTYENDKGKKYGCDKGDETSIDFTNQEYINKAVIRHAKSGVHCLMFESNKGTAIGPCGGGNLLFGEEEEIVAPEGMQLCGIKGHAEKTVKAISLRWSTIRK